jgi:hypothetical protein
VLKTIENGTADLDSFIVQCKQNSELVDQTLKFTAMVFQIDDPSSFENSRAALENASNELNIQIALYGMEGKIECIEKNRFSCPLVISILVLQKEGVDCYFLLYHKLYKEIAVENLNTSNNFYPTEAPRNKVFHLESLAEELVNLLLAENARLKAQELEEKMQELLR